MEEKSVTKVTSKKQLAHLTEGYKRRFTLETSDKPLFPSFCRWKK
jgi:hypothetical protein